MSLSLANTHTLFLAIFLWGVCWRCKARSVLAKFLAAVERIWHTLDSQGQIPALAFREKSLESLNTLETTKRQIDGLCSQLPFECYLPKVTSVGD